MLTENLDKESFWNFLNKKYPEAMQIFCNWIDEYKRENNWDDLFWNNKMDRREHYWTDIKFHHLPLAMQFGIWIEFVQERGGCQWEIDLLNVDWREEIEGYFEFALQPEAEFNKD